MLMVILTRCVEKENKCLWIIKPWIPFYSSLITREQSEVIFSPKNSQQQRGPNLLPALLKTYQETITELSELAKFPIRF